MVGWDSGVNERRLQRRPLRWLQTGSTARFNARPLGWLQRWNIARNTARSLGWILGWLQRWNMGGVGVRSVCPVEPGGAFAFAFAYSNQDVKGDGGAASVLACASSPVGDCEAAGGGIGAGGASGATYGLGTAV